MLKALQNEPVRKEFAHIAVEDPDVFEIRLKPAVNDALTGSTVKMAIKEAMVDDLKYSSVLNALVARLKVHDGYRKHLTACVAPVAEHIVPEYLAQSPIGQNQRTAQ